ncbi:MAG: hypothetical protein ACK5XN_33855 [Bacteroidota bacterium]|jgi:hypothetical protein
MSQNDYKQIYTTNQIVQCTNANDGIIDINLFIPFDVHHFTVKMNITNAITNPTANRGFIGNVLYGCKAPSIIDRDLLAVCADGSTFCPESTYFNSARRSFNGVHRLSFFEYNSAGTISVFNNEIFCLVFTFYG